MLGLGKIGTPGFHLTSPAPIKKLLIDKVFLFICLSLSVVAIKIFNLLESSLFNPLVVFHLRNVGVLGEHGE